MGSKAVDQLRPGDRGRTRRSAFVGDVAGNKYLYAFAEVTLDDAMHDADEVYLEVTADDRLVVTMLAGIPVRVVLVPDGGEESFVWVDEMIWIDAKVKIG